MSTPNEPQDIRVLAIASHVTYGYVGNKMATFVMQALGCDVSAINTVHFSNHTAYKQFAGRKTPAEEIRQLYDGLADAKLNDFDMMLSGYAASPEAVEAVGSIGRDLKDRSKARPGSFFWLLDPVMGDEGRLYVHADIPSVYKTLLPHADLILPNAFEAEILSGTAITDIESLKTAIKKLHQEYRVPHIIVTSLRISPTSGRRNSASSVLAVVGSSCRADYTPRIFQISVPSLPIFFSGTGDMFAALTTVRLREAVEAHSASLIHTESWRPSDDVSAVDLPLAKATERTLASMHVVLKKTAEIRHRELSAEQATGSKAVRASEAAVEDEDGPRGEEEERLEHLRATRASEVRVVRCADDLRRPLVEEGVMIKAVPI